MEEEKYLTKFIYLSTSGKVFYKVTYFYILGPGSSAGIVTG